METETLGQPWLKQQWTKIRIFLAVTAIKLLLIPSYRSTDFEVHRNWMAITNKLPMREWYTNSASEWTLDYPPLFAWFEWVLSQVAKFVDPGMLEISNHNYASDRTVFFMRGSVIVTDLVLATAVVYATRRLSKVHSDIVFFLIVANPGLLIVDHIHFQYNGFLLGILIWSLGFLMEGHDVVGAFLFTVLVNMKHLYAALGPVYAVYLLRRCLRAHNTRQKLFQLFSVVAVVCILSFGPFIQAGQLQQVLRRLFPFGRGLCHAYWAPNAWALYAFLDKALVVALKWADIPLDLETALSTGGLVGGTKFALLPSIPPIATLAMTLIAIAPVLYGVWKTPNPVIFIKALTFCALTSFILGYHVHEKASLTATVPAALTALGNPRSAGNYFLLVVTSTYAMFPLLFTPTEYPIKVMILVTYSLLSAYLLREYTSKSERLESAASTSETTRAQQSSRNAGSPDQEFLSLPEILYLFGLIGVEIYSSVLHARIFKQELPFLPLMLISVYCASGMVWIWSQPDIIDVVQVKNE